MKRALPLILFLCSSLLALSQPYGNEWIRFSQGQPHSDQQYFKVKVWNEGIFRISYSDLQSVSFPMPVNPARLQLFHKGVEQFILVEDGGDGSFDPNDYIEFYGRGNDGSYDKQLYRNQNNQPHDRFSLFTDTAAYFLTVNIDSTIQNRRMVLETDTNSTGFTPVPWLMVEDSYHPKSDYLMRRLADIKDSEYDEGEGYYSGPLTTSQVNYQFYLPNISPDPVAPLTRITASTMGGNNTGFQHAITLSYAGLNVTKYFTGYETVRFDTVVNSNADIQVPLSFLALIPGTGVTNRIHVSYVRLKYPHKPDYAGEYANVRRFDVQGSFGNDKALVQLANANTNSGPARFVVLSQDTVKSVTTTTNGSTLSALVPLYGSDKTCLLIDSTFTATNGRLIISPVSSDPTSFARFRNFSDGNGADYLIITNDSLKQSAADYASYRSSTGFTPLTAYVQELYDQFSYGIDQHPLSIKNFCRFANDVFTLKPQNLLLLGKSINPTRVRYTGTNSFSTTQNNWKLNYVPTFGSPPSDILFTSFSAQDTFPRPVFPVGRISARSNADVYAYLAKISAHESQLQQCPQEWQKRILHFGGGNTASQQQQIRDILYQYEQTARDTFMGAYVKTFLKTSTDPIQIDLSQYLQSLIDSGSTLMTFVAHAGGSSFDISTDIPQNYNNKDRYPLVFANSCFVGDIHDGTRRIAEDFVLLPDKGSIGFLGQPDVGLLDNLQYYGREFYRQMSLVNYGSSVGRIMQAVNDSILNLPLVTSNFSGYFIFKSVMTGMTLSGDPALVLNSFDRTDYQIDNSSISFTPSTITSDLDTMMLNVVVKNLGKATYNPFVLYVSRLLPDGNTLIETDTIIDYVVLQDTISFKIPVDATRSVGTNYFNVYVDYLGSVDECNEANNIVQNVPLNVRSSDIAPVYPSEFAIVPESNGFRLKASTVDPFAPGRNYKFQIDTVRSFNSPFLKQGLVYGTGGVIYWQPPFTLQPDLVYYWRVSRDSLPTDSIHPEWKESSFIHKPAVTGWSQAHYSQFYKDEFTNLIYNERYDSTYKFVSTLSSLEVNNYLNISASYNPNFKINNVLIDYAVCTATPSMHIVVIDSLSLKAWSTRDHTFGEANRFDFNTNAPIPPCNGRGRPDFFFIFRMNDAASRDSMFNMLQNGIPSGNYVIAYTSFGGLFSNWSPQLKGLFSSWGSDSINFLNDTQPYIFFTKKGDTTFTQEVIGDASRPAIQILATLGGNWSKGFVTSVPIGPALGWNELHWFQEPIDAVAGKDSVYVDVIGITPNGTEVPLPGFTQIPAGTYDVNLSSIDANLYPKLRLKAYVQDDSLYTPPHLRRWQIYHTGVPEFALNPSKFFSLNKDSLQEGEEIQVRIAVENVGDIDSDSLLMGYYVLDDARVRHDLPSVRYKPLVVGDTVVSSVTLNTRNYGGLNSLWIEANPLGDQVEYYRFNNLAEIPFRVSKDIINPILDVTFDGSHIMNGDIVSAKPAIQIRLKDENPYLALDDTSDWQIFLKDPSGVSRKLVFEPLACSGPAYELLKWCPADLSGNQFSIEFNPHFMSDGIYELTVQATDASGNLSGANSYKINFEVINKSTISEVINYPNPFSTSTRFVFTLTGSQIPEDFRIQIMTVRGTVVREIGRDEIGPIRIGRNITEFAWNGKDEFGDQLANGVYLYRVVTRLNGVGVEKRETEADKYFVNGWGKMYLMR
jgi:hypothetical protein